MRGRAPRSPSPCVVAVAPRVPGGTAACKLRPPLLLSSALLPPPRAAPARPARRCTAAALQPHPLSAPLPPRRWVAVNEVRLLASLHHPNVVQYKQCFVEDSCLHVIMEVVPNGELAAAVE